MIPEEIVVDVTGLEIGQSIHAHELSIPKGVELVTDGIRTVCSVALPKVLEVEVEDEEEELEEGLEGEDGEVLDADEAAEDGAGDA